MFLPLHPYHQSPPPHPVHPVGLRNMAADTADASQTRELGREEEKSGGETEEKRGGEREEERGEEMRE